MKLEQTKGLNTHFLVARTVFPKERERRIFTVAVWISVVAFCQTGNRARFCTVKGEYEVGIASNAKNVTADRKGKYGWIGQYDPWHSSKVHSYFPSGHLVPILTGREAGNLPMTAVFDSSSPKHPLLLQHSYSEVKPPNSINILQTTYPLAAPNSLKLLQTTYPLATPNSLKLLQTTCPLLHQTPSVFVALECYRKQQAQNSLNLSKLPIP